MALKFYSDSALTTEVTTLTTQHANTGMAVANKLYLGNKDTTVKYQNISIAPTDTSGTDETSYISLALDNSGVAGTYGSAGAVLAMADISDNTGHAFWVKITTPSVSSAQNKTDLQLKANYREFAV